MSLLDVSPAELTKMVAELTELKADLVAQREEIERLRLQNQTPHVTATAKWKDLKPTEALLTYESDLQQWLSEFQEMAGLFKVKEEMLYLHLIGSISNPIAKDLRSEIATKKVECDKLKYEEALKFLKNRFKSYWYKNFTKLTSPIKKGDILSSNLYMINNALRSLVTTEEAENETCSKVIAKFATYFFCCNLPDTDKANLLKAKYEPPSDGSCCINYILQLCREVGLTEELEQIDQTEKENGGGSLLFNKFRTGKGKGKGKGSSFSKSFSKFKNGKFEKFEKLEKFSKKPKGKKGKGGNGGNGKSDESSDSSIDSGRGGSPNKKAKVGRSKRP